MNLQLHGYEFKIEPVSDYRKQSEQLLRYGGNLRTSWARVLLADAQGNRPETTMNPREVVANMITPVSLALGTLITSPQMITFDAKGARNDVEHYSAHATEFSPYIAIKGWDSPVKDTVEAWFSEQRPRLLSLDELEVCTLQHLDASSTGLYLESRAVVAATLLDVLAGRYAAVWSPGIRPHNIPFERKLKRLLTDLDIRIGEGRLRMTIRARNSLVHAGRFLSAESGQTDSEYQNLMLLGRTILLRLVGFPSTLYENMNT